MLRRYIVVTSLSITSTCTENNDDHSTTYSLICTLKHSCSTSVSGNTEGLCSVLDAWSAASYTKKLIYTIVATNTGRKNGTKLLKNINTEKTVV